MIVNAAAISPLVTLLSSGAPEVKEEAAGALSTLAFNSPSTQLAIASGLVVLVGTGSAESQEHVTQLLLTLAHERVAAALEELGGDADHTEIVKLSEKETGEVLKR
mgnify:CR=1 FL=1